MVGGGGHLAGENIQAGASVAVVVAEQRPSLNIGAISVSLTRQSHPRGRRRAEGGGRQGTPTHAQDQPEGHDDTPHHPTTTCPPPINQRPHWQAFKTAECAPSG